MCSLLDRLPSWPCANPKKGGSAMNQGQVLRKATLVGLILFVGLTILPIPDVPAAEKAPIKIGVVLPLSGGLEVFGQQEIQGAKMAVAEINEAGGVLGGRKLELVIEDNKSDPKTSVEKANKLIMKNKVIAILGPVSSANRDAMLPYMAKMKTPLLYATSYEGGTCNRYLFVYGAIPDHFINPFLPFLIKNYGKSFYLFGADYVYPHKMNAAIRQVVLKENGKVVAEEYTPFGVKDFAPVIQKIANSGAEVLVQTLPGADGQTFLKQFSEFGLKKKVKVAWMDFHDNYMSGLTGEQADGVVTCIPFIQSLDRPEAQSFVAKQKKMFGEKVVASEYAEYAYGMVLIFKKAIEKAGATDKEKIIDCMVGQRVVAGNGESIMNADHHMTLSVLIAEVAGGQLKTKEYIGAITPSDQCKGKKP
jgi:ABC-type branched-subunit amino acid transport system substrate-binding protein